MDTFVSHDITIDSDPQHPAFVKLSSPSLPKDIDPSKIKASDQGFAKALLQLQSLANGLASTPFPAEIPGPPQQAVNPGRTPHIEALKKKGNEHFGRKEHQQALQHYSQALEIAISRPPWEPSTVAIEEIATLLSNRSAAFLQAGLAPEAYADAKFCTDIRPQWPKGYFRVAKCLIQLDRLKEALAMVERGLSYDPTNTDLKTLELEVSNALKDHGLSRNL